MESQDKPEQIGRAKEGREKSARKPLRVSVTEIDQEILRLLMRRHNLLEKMRHNGHLEAADEKYLREAWQNDVARVSRDADLSSRFFALMQQISFMPKPSSVKEAANKRRDAFNLAPVSQPVHASLKAPLAESQTQAWMYLASAAGQALQLGPCLQNDTLVDLIRALVQMGASISREEDKIFVYQGSPLATPDRVVHVGSNKFNLFLTIAHYLGRPSRVKITGEDDLLLADFSNLRHFLPTLGARFINVVPKSNSLPCRLESSGLLPAAVSLDAAIPADFAKALLLAAPFYPAPLAVNLSKQTHLQDILAHILPILEKSGATFSLQGDAVSIDPSPLIIPGKPDLPMDLELASFLLSLPAALGGKVKLAGVWPDWPECQMIWQILAKIGCNLEKDGLLTKRDSQIKEFNGAEVIPDQDWQIALISCLGACAALNSGAAALPKAFIENETVDSFMRVAGLKISAAGLIEKGEEYEGLGWLAPSPAWALAFALAACARPNKKKGWPLANPGIMTGLWPQFWAFYNSLPEPRLKKREEAKEAKTKTRRRIRTNVVAEPPELKEDDWE